MEKLDLYNDLGEKLNEVINRGEKIEPGKNIMLSIIYIRNTKGDYLIQKTSIEKGLEYSSTGGHVTSLEDGFMTIKRELKEELGIDSDDIEYIDTFKYPTKPLIINVYFLDNYNLDTTEIKLQEEEVEEVKYISKNEILKLIDDGKFTETHGYIFKKYFNE